ncbi:MAG: hypothetical protein ACK4FM_01890 [Caldimicrobium sp.]
MKEERTLFLALSNSSRVGPKSFISLTKRISSSKRALKFLGSPLP